MGWGCDAARHAWCLVSVGLRSPARGGPPVLPTARPHLAGGEDIGLGLGEGHLLAEGRHRSWCVWGEAHDPSWVGGVGWRSEMGAPAGMFIACKTIEAA